MYSCMLRYKYINVCMEVKEYNSKLFYGCYTRSDLFAYDISHETKSYGIESSSIPYNTSYATHDCAISYYTQSVHTVRF